ncbi:inositol monophosphatase family protein [Helicobacter canis]|uniref:Inositol monophosphatase n=1 Tax=Helicobacter canis NCTC 12740 TaxID=1357399 RepID=V8CKY0_9HELI|nr:inositol monophosphatase family protein [Helicobacter canis]ETD27685.1 hypothetical protein HMPREF2087_00605 [Helicobacter canis NCTC 12740]
MSEFLYATLNAAREIIPLLAMREEHLLQAGAKGAGGDISIGADLLCEEIFTKHLSHIGHIDSEESGFIAAGTQTDSNRDFSDKAQTLSSRDLHQQVVAIHKKADSRIFDKNAQNVFSPNAARRQDLGDKNGALQGESRAHTRAYVTADSPQQNKGYRSALADVSLESPFLAPKPTPKTRKAESTKESQSFLTIVLDPLDGSDNYLSNIPYYGASLALCDSTGAVLEAAVVNFCSAQVIYDHSSAPHASRIHIFTQEHSPIAPTPAKCGVFEKAYSYPDIARELYTHRLKFRSLGASALSLACALEHNFFLFCGAIRKYDALAGLFLCRNLQIARGADFLLVSQNKQVFGMIERILSKHQIKQI